MEEIAGVLAKAQFVKARIAQGTAPSEFMHERGRHIWAVQQQSGARSVRAGSGSVAPGADVVQRVRQREVRRNAEVQHGDRSGMQDERGTGQGG